MSRSSNDAERRKLFRRMEWVFVYVPPLLALFISGFGALFLAFVVPIPNTTFWGRWLLAMGVILVIPTAVYFGRSVFRK